MPNFVVTSPDSIPAPDCRAFEALALEVFQMFLDSPYFPLSAETLPREDLPGVYVLYYRGSRPCYQAWSRFLPHIPLYVGKTSRGVRHRLLKHIRSILDVENAGGGLSLSDFEYRFVRLAPGAAWLADGLETWFISQYSPLWNLEVKGFGNNPQGKERGTTSRADWDLLHAGRERSSNDSDSRTAEDVERLVIAAGRGLLLAHGRMAELDEYEAVMAERESWRPDARSSVSPPPLQQNLPLFSWDQGDEKKTA